MIDYAKKPYERIEDKANEPFATKRTIITANFAKISQLQSTYTFTMSRHVREVRSLAA